MYDGSKAKQDCIFLSMQTEDPLAMFSGDMMTVNVNLCGLPVSRNVPGHRDIEMF